MENFLIIFLSAIACAVVLNVILKYFSIPTIIGYIFTGIVISKIFDINYDENLYYIAEFGIVFLMFSIGLEFSIRHLWSMKTDVFINGAFQVLITGFVFTLIARYVFGINQQTAIIVGLALSLSSTAIVLKILNDSGNISQIYGRKALGILLFQDIAVIPILLMIDIFTSKNTSVSELLITTTIGALILIASLFVIGRYIFNWILYFVIRTKSQEIFVATVLFTVVGASFFASHLGFSHTLGAFLAGMLLAETQYKQQIEADLIPFRDLLLGLFFITVGIQINFSVIAQNIVQILIVLIDVMLIKAVVVAIILIVKQKKRVAIKTAFSLSQIGEFALAIFAILSSNKMLDFQTAQILTTVTILSMIISPFILKNLSLIADKLESTEEDTKEYTKIKTDDLSEHFIVCGYGRLGQEVVSRLKAKGLPYLVLESDISLVRLGRKRGENIFYGSAARISTLEKIGAKNCSAIILAVQNERKIDMITSAIYDFGLNVKTIIRYTGAERELFENLGENFLLIKEERVLAKVLVHEALQAKLNSTT